MFTRAEIWKMRAKLSSATSTWGSWMRLFTGMGSSIINMQRPPSCICAVELVSWGVDAVTSGRDSTSSGWRTLEWLWILWPSIAGDLSASLLDGTVLPQMEQTSNLGLMPKSWRKSRRHLWPDCALMTHFLSLGGPTQAIHGWPIAMHSTGTGFEDHSEVTDGTSSSGQSLVHRVTLLLKLHWLLVSFRVLITFKAFSGSDPFTWRIDPLQLCRPAFSILQAHIPSLKLHRFWTRSYEFWWLQLPCGRGAAGVSMALEQFHSGKTLKCRFVNKPRGIIAL